MVTRPRPWFSRKDTHTMALDQSALFEMPEVLKNAEVDDRIPQAVETTSPMSRTALNRPGAHAGSTNLKFACRVRRTLARSAQR
jgi:hypothetical protein